MALKAASYPVLGRDSIHNNDHFQKIQKCSGHRFVPTMKLVRGGVHFVGVT